MNTSPLRNFAEHGYYVVAAIGIAIVIIVGFTPSYVRRILHDKRYLTLIVHLHGLVMASWIARFFTQA